MRHGLILLSIFLCATFAFAEDKPATQPTTDATVIQASDKDTLAASMDKAIVVEGTIDKAVWSSTGKVMKATFKDAGDSKFSAIMFVANREKFDSAFSGDVTKALAGAKVRLKGKLKDYKVRRRWCWIRRIR